MIDVIPDAVYERIQRHLVVVGNRAQSGWEAGSDEEDTLTGHLGAQLQRGWSNYIRVHDHLWRWQIRYKKFRGRGPGAFEKDSGADGIVQIEVSLSFQAKKLALGRDQATFEQVDKMESVAVKSSGILIYRPEGYRALSGSELLKAVGRDGFVEDEISEPLGSFLGNQFLACKTGLRGMYFDAVRKMLILPPQASTTAVRAELADRLLIEVQELRWMFARGSTKSSR